MCMPSSSPRTPDPMAPVAPGMGSAGDIRLGDSTALTEDKTAIDANRYGISSLKSRQRAVGRKGKGPKIKLKGRSKVGKAVLQRRKDKARAAKSSAREAKAKAKAQDRFDNQSGSGYTYSSPEAARRYAGRQDPTIR